MGIVQENLKRKSPEVQTTDYGATFIKTGGESHAAKVEETKTTMATEAAKPEPETTEEANGTETSEPSKTSKAQKETKSKGRPKKA